LQGLLSFTPDSIFGSDNCVVNIVGVNILIDGHLRRDSGGLTGAHCGGDYAHRTVCVELNRAAATGSQQVVDLFGDGRAIWNLTQVPWVRSRWNPSGDTKYVHTHVAV